MLWHRGAEEDTNESMEQASGVDERRAGPVGHRAPPIGGRGGAFKHEAFLYAGEEEFVAGALSFVAGALQANEPALVAVRDDRAELLREALGDDARRVTLADAVELARNPARLIPAWLRFLEEQAPDRGRGTVIAESIWPGRSAAELSECARYEELLNVAFADGRAWRLVCPYDVAVLDDDAVELARSTHPLLWRHGGTKSSGAYEGADAAQPFEGTLPDPPAGAQTLAFTITGLHALREFVTDAAHRARLSREGTENVRLAVNELASNSIRHGGGAGTLTTWRENGSLICQVSDRGRIREPLVGRLRPAPDQASGRGLWLVNHLCDLVQVRSDDRGSVVRVHMRGGGEGADRRA